MFFKQDLEKKIADIEQKCELLEEENHTLDDQMNELLNKLNITPEQLTKYLSDRSNFSDNNWNQIQTQQQILEDQLQQKIESLKFTPKNTRPKSDKDIQRHWIFVR